MDFYPQEMEQKRFKTSYVFIFIVVLVIVGVLLVYINRGDQVVATVNGEEIGKEELYQAMLEGNGRDILDQLILERLVLQEGDKLGIVVSEAEVDAELSEVVESSFRGDMEQFRQALLEYGITEEHVRERIRIEQILKKIADGRLEITEDAEKEYFAANQDTFGTPEQIEARHMLLTTREEAEAMLLRLDGGEDFAALAKEHSQDPGSAEQGGSLGFFARGQMVPEFDEAAFKLAPGQRSGIVETSFGFHIIEVLNRQEANEVTFEEVRDTVRERMTEELLPAKMTEIIDTIRREADIVYNI
ncbi:MAG TPA: hypothetical protein DCQ14_04690 [Firmicutes bacterium]|nr:hypothetical protein [Bacillota bacterium]